MIRLETKMVSIVYHGKELTKVSSMQHLPIFMAKTVKGDDLHFFSVVLRAMEMPKDRDAYIERITITLASFIRTVELELSDLFLLGCDSETERMSGDPLERYERATHRVAETMYNRKWGDLQPIMWNSATMKGAPCYFILGGWIALIEETLLKENTSQVLTFKNSDVKGGMFITTETPPCATYGTLTKVSVNLEKLESEPTIQSLGGNVESEISSFTNIDVPCDVTFGSETKLENDEGIGFYVSMGGLSFDMVLIVRCLNITEDKEINLLPCHFKDNIGFAMMHSLIEDIRECILTQNLYINPETFRLHSKAY